MLNTVSFLLVIQVFIQALCGTAHASDYSVIRQRLVQINLPIFNSDKEAVDFDTEVTNLSQTLTRDGSWPSVDYQHPNSLDFAPIRHLYNVVRLAQAYAVQRDAKMHSHMILNQINLALRFWIKNDYQSYNWWFNEIGVQQNLMRIILLIDRQLPSDTLKGSLKILRRTKIDQTGQNRLWRSNIVFQTAMIAEDANTANGVVSEVEKLLLVQSDEGIKPDGSFWQHGHMIYNGGYGAGFTSMFANFVYLVNGTQFDVKESVQKLLFSFILDTQQWLIRKDKFDYSVLGRGIALKQNDADRLLQACKILSQAKSPRQHEFQLCYESIQKRSPNIKSGNRFFYLSDYMIHQNAAFSASVHMYSKRTLNNDAPSNGENLTPHHMADGAMLLMKNADEYDGIFGYWNWNKIPGTTTEQKPLVPAKFVPGHAEYFAHIRTYGESTFVGGLSYGEAGIAAMDFIDSKENHHFKAKKSWFFFKDQIVALGTDIQCHDCTYPVYTSIEQAKLKTNVQYWNEDQTLLSNESLDKVKALGAYQNGTAYLFYPATEIEIGNRTQSGRWSVINAKESDELVSGQVFQLGISHGMQPAGASYQYAILPGMSLKEALTTRFTREFTVINTPQVQAVYSSRYKMLSLVFFRATHVKIEGLELSASTPCVVSLQKDAKGEWTVFAADPTQKLTQLQVDLNGKTYRQNYSNAQPKGSTLQLLKP